MKILADSNTKYIAKPGKPILATGLLINHSIFNDKIKAFRRQFRGVRSIEFFLFRLAKLYA